MNLVQLRVEVDDILDLGYNGFHANAGEGFKKVNKETKHRVPKGLHDKNSDEQNRIDIDTNYRSKTIQGRCHSCDNTTKEYNPSKKDTGRYSR